VLQNIPIGTDDHAGAEPFLRRLLDRAATIRAAGLLALAKLVAKEFAKRRIVEERRHVGRRDLLGPLGERPPPPGGAGRFLGGGKGRAGGGSRWWRRACRRP